MKSKLKHIDNQYILIVDERPQQNDWWYHSNGVINNINNELNDPDYNHCWRIIAAENLDGVKGIRFKVYYPNVNRYISSSVPNKYVESAIDTEVEVTEHEDYWLIKL